MQETPYWNICFPCVRKLIIYHSLQCLRWQQYTTKSKLAYSNIPGHDKQFPNHPRTFSNELLYQLGSRHPDEGAFRVVSYSPGQQCFTCPRWTIKQYALQTDREDILGHYTTAEVCIESELVSHSMLIYFNTCAELWQFYHLLEKIWCMFSFDTKEAMSKHTH